jgi:peroxiredoxin
MVQPERLMQESWRGMRRSSCLRSILFGALLLGLAPAPSAHAGGQDQSADEVAQLLRRGKRALEGGGTAEAISLLKKADKLAKGSCLECMVALAAAYNKSGQYDDALKLARQLIELAPPRELLGAAYNQFALALIPGGKRAPEKLKEAELALRHAMELAGRRDDVLRYNLACLLLQTDRREEGVTILREISETNPDPRFAAHVRLLLNDPGCAEGNCAPDFSITTLDGEYFSRDGLKGKVVLFCFCSTTFPPCLNNLPELRRLAKRMEKDPFVVIAVNYDVDPPMLKEFARRNDLRFPVYYDAHGQLTGAFGVKMFPTHVVVNHEGRVVWRSYSLTPEQQLAVSAQVGNSIKEAKRALAATAPPQP